ncbi:DNA-binding response regulator [Romboutsia weinsteinii]|uniref:Stage 0 sporulation protein A homolog n=1 Tax=Romboutsia weinsteinii TaxID=2020949 RepID=A0A371J0Z1_9FIRM|nr:response regulator transcription factor [Romboutsia weinsteinii]RDY26385.1 DNA-binding response regulator [Romboutsia weinsteinii]
MKKILIVEDDITLNKGIMLTLRQNDITIKQAFSIAEASNILEYEEIDLILLDINLPDGNGFDFCKIVKEKFDIPVIFLTACDMEIDIVTGLELGADDYITKPFSLMVLRARVMVALRRLENKPKSSKISIGDMTFNFESMDFIKSNTRICLSRTEQKLLKMLVDHKGQVLTRDQLIDRIWSDGGEYVDENALTVNIKRLRDKIEDDKSKPSYIKTVYGIGYIFNVGDKNER